MEDLLNLIKDQFRLPLNSTHGVLHWKRVEDRGVYLAQFTGADEAVVRYFAYIHDSKRFTENGDPLHALRAGEFVQELFEKGKLCLTKPQLLLLKKSCEVHNTNPARPLDPTIATCLDADRLDLVRMGIQPSGWKLFTKKGKQLCQDG